MFKRIKENIKSETGSVAIISAVILIAAMGLLSLAVDVSVYRNKQKILNNASDAASLAVASAMAANGNDNPEEYKDLAVEVIKANNMPDVEAEDVSFEYVDYNKTVKVNIKDEAPTFFSKMFTHKDSKELSNNSYAQFEITGNRETNSQSLPPLDMDDSIDVGGTFSWQGATGSANGGISIGKNFQNTCSFSTNGDVKCDGDFWANGGVDFNVAGNIYSGGKTLINGNSVVHGNVESMGAIQTENTSHVYGSMKTNSTVFLKSHSTVDGNVEAMGNVNIQEYPTIKGDIRTNDTVTDNWAPSVTVNGIIYDNGGIPKDSRINNIKKSDGSSATINSTVDNGRVTAIEHTPYYWRWDSLADELKDSAVTLTDDAVEGYINEYPEMQYTIQYYAGNLVFIDGGGHNPDIQQFFDYVLQYNEMANDTAIYIPGNLTFNSGAPLKYTGCLIVEKDITMNSRIVMTSNTGNCIASINGNITLGNSGGQADNKIYGAVILLNENNKLILHGGGEIEGAVISHGDLTMNGVWNINPSNDWQRFRRIDSDDDGDDSEPLYKVRLVNEDF